MSHGLGMAGLGALWRERMETSGDILRNRRALLLQLSSYPSKCQKHQQFGKLAMHIYMHRQQKFQDRILQKVHFRVIGSGPNPAILTHRVVPLK